MPCVAPGIISVITAPSQINAVRLGEVIVTPPGSKGIKHSLWRVTSLVNPCLSVCLRSLYSDLPLSLAFVLQGSHAFVENRWLWSGSSQT